MGSDTSLSVEISTVSHTMEKNHMMTPTHNWNPVGAVRPPGVDAVIVLRKRTTQKQRTTTRATKGACQLGGVVAWRGLWWRAFRVDLTMRATSTRKWTSE